MTDDGRAYFYDPITRTTSWDQPEGIGGWQEPIVKQMQRRQANAALSGRAALDCHHAMPNGEGGRPAIPPSSEQRRSRLPPAAAAAAAAAGAADADADADGFDDEPPQVESPQPSGGPPLDSTASGIVVDLAALSSGSGGLTSGQLAAREGAGRPPPQPPQPQAQRAQAPSPKP